MLGRGVRKNGRERCVKVKWSWIKMGKERESLGVDG